MSVRMAERGQASRDLTPGASLASPLERSWHPIAWSEQLKARPIAAEVLGRAVVAFRDEQGIAHVMDDRCAHKGVKLSGGRCTKKGIECPYHGWVFDGRGECVHIPSHPGCETPPVRRIPHYTTREQQGTVWFTFSGQPFESGPPDWHFFDRHSFRTVLDMDCEYIRLMENLIDNPHAGYIHGGLLRGRPTTDVVSHVSETPRGVHAKTVGEKARRSMIYRVFGKKDQEIDHTEEFIVPNIIRTIFSHPGSTHASSQFVCVPVNERKVRVFYRITLDFPLARFFIPFFKRMVDKVLVQDKLMLEHEAKQEWADPEFRKTACTADVAAIWMARAAHAYAAHGPNPRLELKTVSTNYRL
jgi:phenylpropionate dioxygenase-like ring-hydroxylating dioxygenase large terminal subunit